MKSIFLINSPGQLGNCLYRIASLAAYSFEYNIPVYDFSFSKYSIFFEHFRKQYIPMVPKGREAPIEMFHIQKNLRKILRHMMRYNLYKAYNVLEALPDKSVIPVENLHSSKGKTIFFNALFLQNDLLVKKYAKELRDLFSIRKNITRDIAPKYYKIKNSYDEVVAVHIRRGDYATWKDGEFFFELDVYEHFMNEYKAIYLDKKICFLIFSDSDESQGYSFNGLDIYFASGSAIEDLYLMSLCDKIIAPLHSTFSGWASFSGETPIFRITHPNRKIGSFSVNYQLR